MIFKKLDLYQKTCTVYGILLYMYINVTKMYYYQKMEYIIIIT